MYVTFCQPYTNVIQFLTVQSAAGKLNNEACCHMEGGRRIPPQTVVLFEQMCGAQIPWPRYSDSVVCGEAQASAFSKFSWPLHCSDLLPKQRGH